MYLSELLVSYESAIRHLHIRDSYDWHQRIWQAFRGRDGEQRDFLVRIDEIDDCYRVLLVSPTAPSKPDWCPAECFRTKPIPDSFFRATRYRFSLLANPTKTVVVRDTDGNRRRHGQRVALTRREDLMAWLIRKAAAGGFRIADPDAIRTIPKPRSYFRKGSHQGVHHAVEFQGILDVTDPDQFRTTFLAGIGRAKAFGFGLLALSPLS